MCRLFSWLHEIWLQTSAFFATNVAWNDLKVSRRILMLLQCDECDESLAFFIYWGLYIAAAALYWKNTQRKFCNLLFIVLMKKIELLPCSCMPPRINLVAKEIFENT